MKHTNRDTLIELNKNVFQKPILYKKVYNISKDWPRPT